MPEKDVIKTGRSPQNNEDENADSENQDENGRDYRLETEGPHPIERYRSREKVMV